jgi:hypothetical protein
VLFYDFPEWVFVLAYVLFALLVAATFWIVRPASAGKKKGRSAPLS